MDIDKLTIEELKNGYRFDVGDNSYIWNACGKVVEEREVFSLQNRFFETSRNVFSNL